MKKLRIFESTDLQEGFSLSDLEKYINAHAGSIMNNMEQYGWSMGDIKGLTNPYDVASLLGCDSRAVRDADLGQITDYVVSLLDEEEDD